MTEPRLRFAVLGADVDWTAMAGIDATEGGIVTETREGVGGRSSA
jgi:hypothetical protein